MNFKNKKTLIALAVALVLVVSLSVVLLAIKPKEKNDDIPQDDDVALFQEEISPEAFSTNTENTQEGNQPDNTQNSVDSQDSTDTVTSIIETPIDQGGSTDTVTDNSSKNESVTTPISKPEIEQTKTLNVDGINLQFKYSETKKALNRPDMNIYVYAADNGATAEYDYETKKLIEYSAPSSAYLSDQSDKLTEDEIFAIGEEFIKANCDELSSYELTEKKYYQSLGEYVISYGRRVSGYLTNEHVVVFVTEQGKIDHYFCSFYIFDGFDIENVKIDEKDLQEKLDSFMNEKFDATKYNYTVKDKGLNFIDSVLYMDIRVEVFEKDTGEHYRNIGVRIKV